ncbi:MAG: hypothetical protein V1794_06905 [Candidatus Glassbacteria bacterium]
MLPLDHVTVIQQINFAEREHQNLQTHPERSQLASGLVDLRNREAALRKTMAVHPSARSRIHLREEDREKVGKSLGRQYVGRMIDLRA